MVKKDCVLGGVAVRDLGVQGLGVVAAKPLAIGTVVLQERPYATALLPNAEAETCRACFTPISAATKGLQRCRRLAAPPELHREAILAVRHLAAQPGPPPPLPTAVGAPPPPAAAPPVQPPSPAHSDDHAAAPLPPPPRPASAPGPAGAAPVPPLALPHACHAGLLTHGSALDRALAEWQLEQLLQQTEQGIEEGRRGAEGAAAARAELEALAAEARVGGGLGVLAALLASAARAGHSVWRARVRSDERRQRRRQQREAARRERRAAREVAGGAQPSSSSGSSSSSEDEDDESDERATGWLGLAALRALRHPPTGGAAAPPPAASVPADAAPRRTAGTLPASITFAAGWGAGGVTGSEASEVAAAAQSVAAVLSNALEVALHPPFAAGLIGSGRATPAASAPAPTVAVPAPHSAPLALYRYGCRVNHSCRPTAALHFRPGGQLMVRLTADLPAGGQVSAAYVDPALPRGRRRALLRDRYGFDCACERCVGAPVEWARHLQRGASISERGGGGGGGGGEGGVGGTGAGAGEEGAPGASADELLSAVPPARQRRRGSGERAGAGAGAARAATASGDGASDGGGDESNGGESSNELEARLVRLVGGAGEGLLRGRVPAAEAYAELTRGLDQLAAEAQPAATATAATIAGRHLPLPAGAEPMDTDGIGAAAGTGSSTGVGLAPQHSACLDAYTLLASAARRAACAPGPGHTRGGAVGREGGGDGSGATPAEAAAAAAAGEEEEEGEGELVWWGRAVCASLAGVAAAERLVSAEPGLLQHTAAAWSDAASGVCELLAGVFRHARATAAAAATPAAASSAPAHNGAARGPGKATAAGPSLDAITLAARAALARERSRVQQRGGQRGGAAETGRALAEASGVPQGRQRSDATEAQLEELAAAAAVAAAHSLARCQLLLRVLLGEAHGACEACQFLPFFTEGLPYEVAAEVTEVASQLFTQLHMPHVPLMC
ncbi:hypothetical protein GPECTOR_50g641 [Gonium pectorale]|uniref:Uncharacterized protein n=1 Tax=Gonium pectorale TaxID=33097 RepID=A0A150G7M4_GONPE|nr:hypothetical protein GPECTOR_50g641 [Gonium pectorale]|eukprot:KXZ45847.1 hypothetical protein GPECTOR_50g641 [Gonium pectorale]